MAVKPGTFVWYDLATSDPGAAERFYTAVVGWQIQPFEPIPDYRLWVAPGGPIGGVAQLDASGVPGWLAYVSVDDADAAAARVRELGGRILVEPTDIPNGGRFTVFADPQGAVLAAYRSSSDDPAPAGGPGVGEFSWHELATSDPVAALEFYGRLFGWEPIETVEMEGAGSYRMFSAGDGGSGGLYDAAGESTAWLHYVRVGNLDRAVAAVRENGGRIVVEPMEVPGGDLVATALDPQGIMFALHEKRDG